MQMGSKYFTGSLATAGKWNAVSEMLPRNAVSETTTVDVSGFRERAAQHFSGSGYSVPKVSTVTCFMTWGFMGRSE